MTILISISKGRSDNLNELMDVKYLYSCVTDEAITTYRENMFSLALEHETGEAFTLFPIFNKRGLNVGSENILIWNSMPFKLF